MEGDTEALPFPGVLDLDFFGRALQAARLEANLSQDRLSRLTGVPRRAISLMETGEAWMALPYWLRICRLLGLSNDELCGLRINSVEQELYLEMRRCPGIATLFLQFLQTPHAAPQRRALTPAQPGRLAR